MGQFSDNLNPAADPQAIAGLGARLVAGVRAGAIEEVAGLLLPNSPAALALELFGLTLFRLDLRLDDPRENGQLAPYDLQLDTETAWLELGRVNRQADHLTRLFGSGLVLRPASESEIGWLIEEILPLNADGQFRDEDDFDRRILETHQGFHPLPLRLEKLDEIESIFLEQMQTKPGHFNLEELFNAVRLWRDYRAVASALIPDPAWAAAIEYLISLFDYHTADLEDFARRYAVTSEAVTDHAREIAQTLRVTQFDDKYSIHADPIAHYRELFGELGIDPSRDEKVRLAASRNQIFDSVEVPPDDEDFWG